MKASALQTYSKFLAGIAFLLGILPLFGWTLGVVSLKDTMKLGTAVSVILISVSIWLLRKDSPSLYTKAWAKFLSFSVTAISSASLAAFFSAAGGPINFGAMRPLTAGIFLILGLCISSLARGYFRLGQILAAASAMAALVCVFSLLYGSDFFFHVPGVSRVGGNSAVSLFLLGLAALLLKPAHGIMEVITSDTSGGRVARQLIPFAVLVPFFLTSIRVVGQRRGFYSWETGVLLFAAACVVLFAGIIYAVAARLKKGDEEKAVMEEGNLRRTQVLKTIAENVGSCLFMLDENGRPTYMNPTAEKVTGFSLAEIKNKPLHFSIHHLRPDGSACSVEECPITRPASQIVPISNEEEAFIKKDGSFFPASFSLAPIRHGGEVIASVLEIRDITEERKGRDALCEAQDRLRLAMEGAGMGTFDVDVGTGKTIWSVQSFKTLGYPVHEKGEATVEMWVAVLHPEDRDWVLAEVARSKNNRTLFQAEYRIIRTDDRRVVWLSVTGRYLYNGNEEPARLVGVFFDVTEHKLAEQKLIEEKKNLERSNLELDSFVYIASHDLRSPIRHITSIAGILQKEYADRLDPEGREFLQDIMQAGQTMNRLVLDLLSLSRVKRMSNAFDRIEMRDVIEAVKGRLKLEIGKTRAVIAADADLPQIYFDRIKITEVFVNLVGNALKFSSKGGKIPIVHIGSQSRGDQLEIFVKDNGVGIDPVYADVIFDMFKRLHGSDEYEGAGIGLSIVKRIMEQCGGTVRVESEPGQGSTFFIGIPKMIGADINAAYAASGAAS